MENKVTRMDLESIGVCCVEEDKFVFNMIELKIFRHGSLLPFTTVSEHV